MNTPPANDAVLEDRAMPSSKTVTTGLRVTGPGVVARVLNAKALWPLFLLILSLPTLLALASVVGSLFNLDIETLAHLGTPDSHWQR